jgi:hypothetical protein
MYWPMTDANLASRHIDCDVFNTGGDLFSLLDSVFVLQPVAAVNVPRCDVENDVGHDK